METNVYRNKQDKSMWIRLPTGKNDKDTGKMAYKSYTVNKLIPELPDVVWSDTQKDGSEFVKIDLDKFLIEEMAIPWELDAITTVEGKILSPKREGVRYELVLKSKTA